MNRSRSRHELRGVELLVHVLAVHRLAQLWTQDVITRPWRVRIIRRAYLARERGTPRDDETVQWFSEATDRELDEYAHGDADPPKVVYLVKCWWCAGFWLSLVWTALALVSPRVRRLVSPAFAASTTTVLVANVIARTAPDDN